MLSDLFVPIASYFVEQVDANFKVLAVYLGRLAAEKTRRMG